ncbi:MAG: nucleoside deaminase [Halomonas sp.]|nr:nucleoside deaminase [Halomonas sp.]
MIDAKDMAYLERCVALAEQALKIGDEPFGSILVSGNDEVLAEDHNHVAGGDATQHPEFFLARWAAEHLTPEERARTTVYTSGEHCPMCAAAHGWVGLGRIVYASSSQQLIGWLQEIGASPAPVAALPIHQVVPNAEVEGPVPAFAQRLRGLHRRLHGA